MKKSKKALRLNKLIISKLNNTQLIRGGSDDNCNVDSEELPLCPRPTKKDNTCPPTFDNCDTNQVNCFISEGC